MPKPYKLFTIYAREDAQYLEELRGQLRPLEIAGHLKVWSDREINPGVDWEREIVHNLDTADIIVILVSSAYYNSVFIHEKEIKYALSRHEKGETKMLPIIVRPCSFGDDPIISRLQVLPTDGKPVTDRRHWAERDDAWLDVVAGVKRTISIILDAENRSEQETREAAERERLAAERKKEEEQRARQAEKDALERTERERREAEQRTREEQARFEREAEERAENERLAQLRLEREQEARRAEQAAWQQATAADDIPDYENYLAHYPQGEYIREVRYRIKELRRGRKGLNSNFTNKWIIFPGIIWGLLVIPLIISIKEYDSGISAFVICSALILGGIATITFAAYSLNHNNSVYFITLWSFIYLGIKIGMIAEIVSVVLAVALLDRDNQFFVDFSFIMLLVYIVIGSITGLIYGLIARKNKVN